MSGDGGFSLNIAVCGCLIDASRYKSDYKSDYKLEWYVIKVPDPDCRPLRRRSSSSSSSSSSSRIKKRKKKKKKEKVRTMISTKLLSPISVTESDPLSLCKNHLAIGGSSLYCFGGLILDSDRDAHEKVWRLDLDLDSPRPSGDWNSVPLMKFYKRWEPRTLALHNKLYVLGGFYSQKSRGTFPIPAEAGWMEEFDPSLQEWKALPNPPFGIYSVPAIAVPLHAKKQILVAYYSDLRHYNLEFYIYDVMSRSWTIFGSESGSGSGSWHRCIDDSTPLTGRVVMVDNTLYWPSLEDLQEAEMCTIYAYNLDLDVLIHGFFSARSILDDADTAEHMYCNSEPPGLIHLGGRKFCLLLPSSSRGSYYLNCLVLLLDDSNYDLEYDYQLMTISILSNQKYALPHYIDLWDNVLLE